MAAILAFLRAFASTAFLYPLIARVLVALGVSVVAYSGMNALLGTVVSSIASNYGGLPADVLAVLAIAHVPQALSVLLSALSARLVLMGVTASGLLRRASWTGGGAVTGGGS